MPHLVEPDPSGAPTTAAARGDTAEREATLVVSLLGDQEILNPGPTGWVRVGASWQVNSVALAGLSAYAPIPGAAGPGRRSAPGATSGGRRRAPLQIRIFLRGLSNLPSMKRRRDDDGIPRTLADGHEEFLGLRTPRADPILTVWTGRAGFIG